jgi:hypothetical protein
MSPIVRTGLLVAVLAAAGITAASLYRNRVEDYEFLRAQDRLRLDFLERAVWVRSIPNDDTYGDENAALLKWYFAELTDLFNRFPKKRNAPDGMAELEARARKGFVSSQDVETAKEWYDTAKEMYAAMEKGYRPHLTAHKEAMRLDVVSVRRALLNGQPRLRVDFLLWGVPRQMTGRETEGGQKQKRMTVQVAFKQLAFKFLDGKGNIVAEMSGGGEPHLKVEYPERWIATFPPQALTGTWYLEVFPREAARVAWSVEVQGRSLNGNEVVAKFDWEVPVHDDWKLKEGEKWEAQEMVMPEEYIQRKEGAE